MKQPATTRYAIWAEVSGGVTGNRAAWLKRNDQVQIFDSYEEAAKVAAELQQRTQGNPLRTANFSYTAEPYTG